MKCFNEFINESEIDDSQLYFHGSAKPRMTKIDTPTFEHPFYVTSDLEYALAYSQKRYSSTGEYSNDIQFSKTTDDTFVYIVSLDNSKKFLDIRDLENTEFEELCSLFPKNISYMLKNCTTCSYYPQNSINGSYDSAKNNIYYIFYLIKSTAILLNKSNPNNKLYTGSALHEFLGVRSNNAIPDKVKNNQQMICKIFRANRINADSPYLLSPDLFSDVRFDQTIFHTFDNAIFECYKDVASDKILSNIDSSTTVHQLMAKYFKMLHQRGYAGVITGEQSSDNAECKLVSTDYAVGIWDASAIGPCLIVPMKYKWLKKVVSMCKNDTGTALAKIKKYVSIYNSLASKHDAIR